MADDDAGHGDPVPSWDAVVGAELDRVRAAGRWRHPRDLATTGAMTGVVGTRGAGGKGEAGGGREVVSFASNDYLGLTHHPVVKEAAREAIERWGTGTGASRLVVGSRPLHGELEDAVAEWKGTEDAVLFPTGYQANLGVLTTLVGAGDGVTVLSDELNHASIVDACRLSRATVRIVRHNDLDHVDALLSATRGPAIVVTDSAFSMDGDVADVKGLVTVCSWYGALLVLDEAHAVLGPEVPAPEGPASPHDPMVVRIGTLSKTLASLGGFVAGPRSVVDLLRNRARTFIFTTALTPADTAAALAALRVVRSEEGEALVGRLRGHVDRLVPGHPTPILPYVLGEEAEALAASAELLDQGLLVPAIRPPTVAVGTSRLRVALSAAHTDDQVDRLVAALEKLGAPAPGGTDPAGGPRGATRAATPTRGALPAVTPLTAVRGGRAVAADAADRGARSARNGRAARAVRAARADRGPGTVRSMPGGHVDDGSGRVPGRGGRVDDGTGRAGDGGMGDEGAGNGGRHDGARQGEG